MDSYYKKLSAMKKTIRTRCPLVPSIGIVLGSGLGEFAKEISLIEQISYSELSGLPVSTVEGHSGRFILGELCGKPIIIMQGRVHFYEGYPMQSVVMPIRLMGLLGIKTLILTNAAGGIDRRFKPGEFMLLSDHISSFVPSPLAGANVDELGIRFPDMTDIYDRSLRKKALNCAAARQIPLHEGVYVQAPGPNFETPAEIHMYETLGANAVGMSTACEAIAARHMGLRVLGISCISNWAAGVLPGPVTHDEVNETMQKATLQFSQLISDIISIL